MNFFKTLIITVMLASPFVAFGGGGDNPVEGIDIIIKKPGVAAKQIHFTSNEMRAVNKLKGLEKPDAIAMIAGRKAKKHIILPDPKVSFYQIVKKALVKEWCFECNGGKTVVKIASANGKTGYVVTIRIKPGKIKPGKIKPAITKMKTKAAVKGMVKKK